MIIHINTILNIYSYLNQSVIMAVCDNIVVFSLAFLLELFVCMVYIINKNRE